MSRPQPDLAPKCRFCGREVDLKTPGAGLTNARREAMHYDCYREHAAKVARGEARW